jgi:hypothetical protein
MREVADADRIRRFMQALGRAADAHGSCYLTGGATAVLVGWRGSTIDVDVRLVPEAEALLRAIQQLKNELRINVELASPADFIPVRVRSGRSCSRARLLRRDRVRALPLPGSRCPCVPPEGRGGVPLER